MRARFTYVNVVGTLALFIALGGVSYAAAKAPKNSVATKSIKKNAVTSAKIKSNAVTSAKVKNSSLTGADFKAGSLTGAKFNLTTLGTVPRADLAATTPSVINVRRTASASTGGGSYGAARAAAPKIPLASYGHVSVYGKCFIYGTYLNFVTYAETDAGYASIYGYSASTSEYQVAPATNEDDRRISDDDVDSGADEDEAEGVFVLGPDGKGLHFSMQNWARHGASGGAPSFLGPDQCAWMLSGQTLG